MDSPSEIIKECISSNSLVAQNVGILIASREGLIKVTQEFPELYQSFNAVFDASPEVEKEIKKFLIQNEIEIPGLEERQQNIKETNKVNIHDELLKILEEDEQGLGTLIALQKQYEATHPDRVLKSKYLKYQQEGIEKTPLLRFKVEGMGYIKELFSVPSLMNMCIPNDWDDLLIGTAVVVLLYAVTSITISEFFDRVLAKVETPALAAFNDPTLTNHTVSVLRVAQTPKIPDYYGNAQQVQTTAQPLIFRFH